MNLALGGNNKLFNFKARARKYKMSLWRQRNKGSFPEFKMRLQFSLLSVTAAASFLACVAQLSIIYMIMW